jgi:hypothetical protein
MPPSELPKPQGELSLIRYETPECVTAFSLDPTNETVWATEQQMATLFGVGVPAISKHITNIYAVGELTPQATFSKMEIVREEGKRCVRRPIDHYNLDMILSVGYRVSSPKATAFRRWATQTLRDYIVQGFALNEARLRDDPHALRELAARVRALRADEQNVYKNVRDVFAFGSTDYDKDSNLIRTFYAKLQDKFLYAATGKTAAELTLARADYTKPAMGLTSMKGDLPERADVETGKNYLEEDELYSLHILCEQFLLFVESKAIRGQSMTMAELSFKFDDLLRFQGHTVFSEYKEYLVQRAKSHAQREFDLWRERVRTLPRDTRRLA